MAAAIFWILKVFLLSVTCRGQVVEELKRLNIPPENLVGNEIYTDLTIDEILVQALGGLDVAAQKMIGPGGNILAELDMNMTEEQFQHFYPAPQYGSMDVMPYFEPKRKKRKAVRRIDLRWKNGTVPYYFARGHFSSKEEYMIKVSMREWEKYTCIKFREKTNEDRNYIRFQNGQGCNSQLGMVGGEQILNLDANGCRWKGLYLHEIGHALGLVHEHQLPNRDQFIDIIFSNIAPSMRVWFQKYTTNEVNQFDVSYQLSSVMHYGMTAFSVDGRQQTIRPKNRTSKDVIGKVWRKELAFSDVKAVNRMYQCADSCSKSIRCGNGGFVDQNCKCICPDGTDDCQEILPGDEKKNQEDDGSCENIYNSWACNTWASQGECEINPKFMKVSCKKACGVCGKDSKKQKDNHVATWSWQWIGHFLNLFPKNWMIDDCKDEFKSIKCQDWAKNGDCVTNEDWMVKNCKKSCRKCKKQPTDANCRNAHTDDAECQKWARKGDCEINKDWMTRNCKKACKLCNAPTSDDPRDDQKDEPDSKDGNDRKPKNRDDSNTDDKGDCRDKHNTKQCKVWADKGECSRNPKWMIPNCRKSCSRCKDGTCKNLYDDRKCKIWARDRECLKNPVWMSENCAESCQTCEKKNRNDEDTDVGRREPEKDNDKDVKTTIKPKEPKDDPTTEDKTCQNDNNDHECNTWAKHGHCDINPAYMVPNCRKACKKCAGDSKGECFDTKVSCKAWAKDGFCSRYPANVVRQCRKSCGLCNSECFDRHTLCKVWAKANRCESDAGYMTIFCKKSCELC